MKSSHSINIYKLMLDILWYTFIVIISVWTIVNIFSIASDGIVKGIKMSTFNVQAKSINDSPFKFSDNFDFSVGKQSEFQLTLDNFKISQIGKSFILVYIISSIITFLLVMWQVKLLREFLGNIIDKKIFTPQNVAKLRNIAILELITAPLTLLYYLIMSIVFKTNHVLNPNFIFVTDYAESFEPLISALEYFVFAGVFSFGLKLKQEQDLTI